MAIPRHSSAVIEQMRPVGSFVADVLAELVEFAKPGVNLLELDELAHRRIRKIGATSCYIDYHPSLVGHPLARSSALR